MGVSFAVVLIFMQLGFREALFDSSVRYHRTLGYGLALIAPRTDNLTRTLPFARSRLFQVLSDRNVTGVSPVYREHIQLVNPEDRSRGRLITSELNFARLFPNRKLHEIDLGLVELAPGADPRAVQARLRERLPKDVQVLTREEFVALEVSYWNGSTPIGYVFTFGAIMGVVVGAIIVYQILFSDVQDHLREYATLRAMGYPQSFLCGVVLREAAILALLGFLPGVAATLWLYVHAGAATRLPIEMTVLRGVAVWLLASVMCGLSGLLAVRKLRSADPAGVF